MRYTREIQHVKIVMSFVDGRHEWLKLLSTYFSLPTIECYCQVLDVLLTLTNFFYKLNPSIARVIYLDGRVGEREVKV